MKLTDKRFCIAWLVLLILAIVSCMAGGRNEDTALLGLAYALSLLSTWLCHRVRPRAAFGNLIVMIAYNAILSYNLFFNSRYGAGLTWWFFFTAAEHRPFNRFADLYRCYSVHNNPSLKTNIKCCHGKKEI